MNKISHRKWSFATAALLLALGGTAAAQQGGVAAAGAADQGASGHDHSGGGGGMGRGGMGRGMMGQGMMGQGMMDHGMMDHSGMDHGGMDHGGATAKGGEVEQRGEGHDKHGMMMKHLCGAGEHIEGRLAYVKAELKLTDAQAAQWSAFADAYRTTGQKLAQYCASPKDHKMPGGVLEQLGMMERNMTVHLDAVRAIRSAAEPLFAALSDDQKKTAEEAMAGVMALGMGGMGKH